MMIQAHLCGTWTILEINVGYSIIISLSVLSIVGVLNVSMTIK